MKTKRLTLYTLLITMTVLLAVVLAYAINVYKRTHFSCTAAYTATRGDNVFLSKSSLILDGNKGMLMIDGKITYPKEPQMFFKLRNSFKVERTHFAYHFFSEKVSIQTNSNAYLKELSEFLSDIIIKEGQDSFFYIYPINQDYIVYSGSMPMMYCMKKTF